MVLSLIPSVGARRLQSLTEFDLGIAYPRSLALNLIATDVDDSIEKLAGKLAAEAVRPNHALDPYFYRSHLVHDLELEQLIFKSWIYALHESEIPNPGDNERVFPNLE